MSLVVVDNLDYIEVEDIYYCLQLYQCLQIMFINQTNIILIIIAIYCFLVKQCSTTTIDSEYQQQHYRFRRQFGGYDYYNPYYDQS